MLKHSMFLWFSNCLFNTLTTVLKCMTVWLLYTKELLSISVCPEIGNSSVWWAQLSRWFLPTYLWMETHPFPEKVSSLLCIFRTPDTRGVQKLIMELVQVNPGQNPTDLSVRYMVNTENHYFKCQWLLAIVHWGSLRYKPCPFTGLVPRHLSS